MLCIKAASDPLMATPAENPITESYVDQNQVITVI